MKLATKDCQGFLVFQGCSDPRENQASQGIRVSRGPQVSQELEALVAPLGHLEFQVQKGNQASQGPLGSLV